MLDNFITGEEEVEAKNDAREMLRISWTTNETLLLRIT